MKLVLPSLFLLVQTFICTNTLLADETTSREVKIPVIEEVIVTGSLLPRGDFVSNAPITTVSSEQFEMTNTMNVESLINSMPQVIGGSDRSSNFGLGIATANLRGLGENRTLVLVNSRRFVPTFPDAGTVDLNFIPVGLIDRVEILTGGASAAYGSDALAGVINFILKDEMNGWDFNFGTQLTDRGDGEMTNFNVTNGGNFAEGKGKYLAHFDILDRSSVKYKDRSFSSFELTDGVDANGQRALVRSSGSFPFTDSLSTIAFIDPFNPLTLGPNGRFLGHSEFDANGVLSPSCDWPAENCDITNSDAASDLNDASYLSMPQERLAFKGNMALEITDQIEFYADLTFSTSEVDSGWRGPFIGLPTDAEYTIPIDNNPFIAEQAKYILGLGTPTIEGQFGGGQSAKIDEDRDGLPDFVTPVYFWRHFQEEFGDTEWKREFETYQLELGLRGEINQFWDYDVFIQVGEVDTRFETTPLIDVDRLQQALLVDADGNCVDSSNGCVGADIYRPNGLSPEAVAFVLADPEVGIYNARNRQTVVMGTISGNTSSWFSMPGDAGPIGAVLGFEYREVEAKQQTHPDIENNQYEGWADWYPFSLDAGTDNLSIFTEALVPLASGKKGIDFLELEIGARYTDHSETGGTTTWKAALAYYPIPDIQIRASKNSAMRSPSISELFQYQEAEFNLPAPCIASSEGGLPGLAWVTYPGNEEYNSLYVPRDARLREICLSQGVPEERLFSASALTPTFSELTGGNLNLEPETSETLSFGFVWTPYTIDGLSVAVDYYQVEIENYINRTPINLLELWATCFDLTRPASGIGSKSCNAITRNEQGDVTEIFRGFQNLGLHELTGWDINVSYNTEFLGGYLDINYVATKISKRTIEDSGWGDVNLTCVGIFNGDCDNIVDYPVPDFKHRTVIAWSKDRLNLQLVWKLLGSLSDGDDDIEHVVEKLDTYSLVDLSSSFFLSDSLEVVAGVKNLLDERPQAVGSNISSLALSNSRVRELGSTNTIPQFYDVFGRTVFLRVSMTL